MDNLKTLSALQTEELLNILKTRFLQNMNRHAGLEWEYVRQRLEANAEKLWQLNEMEQSGGEPDVLRKKDENNELIFYDCSPESPIGRRSLCYDHAALETRKNNKPKGSAEGVAAGMGLEILSKEQYIYLQSFGNFDLKTSSWLKTPEEVRQLGGALFGDRRYNQVFIYHNGAESYYAARGFRALLKV